MRAVSSGLSPFAAAVPMQFQHESTLYNEALNVGLSPVPFSGGPSPTAHPHELFHFIQSRTVGGTKATSTDGLWWVEAAADYAACNIVWPEINGFKGGGSRLRRPIYKRNDAGVVVETTWIVEGHRFVYPYLLERPLYSSGLPTNDHNLDGFGGTWDTGQELEVRQGRISSSFWWTTTMWNSSS